MEKKTMKLLLIEDDESACKKFKELENTKDIQFISINNSVVEAIKNVKRYMPEGIILDLELNNGQGNGFEFLQELRKLNLTIEPKVIVTTNVYSDSVYDFLHENKVDFIFYKKQQNYSQENVINTLLLLRNYESKNKTNEILSYENQTAEEKEQLISDMVDKELDLIGIGKHLAGREYIHTAICYLILHQGQDDQEPTIKYLSSVYKKPASTISRNMQNAIISAWRISAIEDLEKYYTARINVHTGVPTPNEFIYYYVDKIKKMI